MANDDLLDRYLNDAERPRLVGSLDPIVEARTAAVSIPVRQSREDPPFSTRPSFSSSLLSNSAPPNRSTVSTSNPSSPRSSVLSRRDTSSTWSSISEGGPLEETVNQHTLNMEFQGPYVCVLNVTGCRSRFALHDFENWYRHSLLHFHGRSLPTRTRCIFCDQVFENATPEDCWRQKMSHIAEHFDSGYTFEEDARPDFALVRHLYDVGLINSTLYEALKSANQRPNLEGFCPYDHTPKSMQDKIDQTQYRDNLVRVKEKRRSRPSRTSRHRN